MNDLAANNPTRPRTIRAAAVQLEGVVGDVAENLRRLETMIDEAAGKGARLIAVPEFATSPLPFRAEVHGSVLPPENRAVEMLRAAARRHGCFIGGSMLIADGEAVYNRYHLVEPDGRIHLHDKDLPTMWENAFYEPGHDDGVCETSIGPMGAAVCWELIRTQTVRRLLGRVEVMMTGTHWWTLPSNWGGLVDRTLGPLAQYNRYLSENAPSEFARRIGTPVIQASHCGRFRTDFMLVPGVAATAPYDTEYVGATQITDAHGRVLVSRRAAEGSGVVVADIELGAHEPVVPLEDTFWIPKLPLALRGYWHHQNLCAKRYYRRTGREAGLMAARRPVTNRRQP